MGRDVIFIRNILGREWTEIPDVKWAIQYVLWPHLFWLPDHSGLEVGGYIGGEEGRPCIGNCTEQVNRRLGSSFQLRHQFNVWTEATSLTSLGLHLCIWKTAFQRAVSKGPFGLSCSRPLQVLSSTVLRVLAVCKGEENLSRREEGRLTGGEEPGGQARRKCLRRGMSQQPGWKSREAMMTFCSRMCLRSTQTQKRPPLICPFIQLMLFSVFLFLSLFLFW